MPTTRPQRLANDAPVVSRVGVSAHGTHGDRQDQKSPSSHETSATSATGISLELSPSVDSPTKHDGFARTRERSESDCRSITSGLDMDGVDESSDDLSSVNVARSFLDDEPSPNRKDSHQSEEPADRDTARSTAMPASRGPPAPLGGGVHSACEESLLRHQLRHSTFGKPFLDDEIARGEQHLPSNADRGEREPSSAILPFPLSTNPPTQPTSSDLSIDSAGVSPAREDISVPEISADLPVEFSFIAEHLVSTHSDKRFLCKCGGCAKLDLDGIRAHYVRYCTFTKDRTVEFKGATNILVRMQANHPRLSQLVDKRKHLKNGQLRPLTGWRCSSCATLIGAHKNLKSHMEKKHPDVPQADKRWEEEKCYNLVTKEVRPASEMDWDASETPASCSFRPVTETMPDAACVDSAEAREWVVELVGSDAQSLKCWTPFLLPLVGNTDVAAVLARLGRIQNKCIDKLKAAAEYFFGKAEVFVKLLPGNARAALLSFNGLAPDDDVSKKKTLFGARKDYSDCLKAFSFLLKYMLLEHEGVVEPYAKYTSSAEYTLKAGYETALIPSLLVDMANLKVASLGNGHPPVFIATVLYCFNLNGGVARVLSASRCSSMVATMVHLLKLGAAGKVLSTCSSKDGRGDDCAMEKSARRYTRSIAYHYIHPMISSLRKLEKVSCHARPAWAGPEGVHVNMVLYPHSRFPEFIPLARRLAETEFDNIFEGESMLGAVGIHFPHKCIH